MSSSLRLAYLTSAFARPSDTFVRSEVDRLRALGVDVQTFSIRRPENGDASNEDVERHQASTDYILEAGLPALLFAAIGCALTHPMRFFAAKRLAWQTSGRGLKFFFLQCIYLLEAAYLAKRLRQQKISHLHNHIGENSATVAMLASCLSGVPYSLTIHGPAIFTAPQRWALGTKLDRAAFTACISSFCRSQCMLYAEPSTWERLYVVRCAVGEEFLPPPERTTEDPRLIVCVGRLCVDKAQRLLGEAAARLSKEGLSFRLLLIGDGPERQAIEEIIEREKLTERVAIAGWQSSDEIKRQLQRASVFALPSFAEGLPIVIMEALASECPVISTNIAAIGELVVPGENGWLIPAGDSEQLVEVLREAITAPAEELAAKGREGQEEGAVAARSCPASGTTAHAVSV